MVGRDRIKAVIVASMICLGLAREYSGQVDKFNEEGSVDYSFE